MRGLMSESNCEIEAQLLFYEILHSHDFMLVDRCRNCLQLQREPTLPEQGHSAQTALVAPFNSGQGFVGFLRAAIQA